MRCRILLLLLLAIFMARGEAVADPLRLAGPADQPPYAFLAEDGTPQGILVDLWRIWSEVTGREVRFLLASGESPERRVRTGKADLVMGMAEKPAIDSALFFSRPIAKRSIRAFARPDIGGIREAKDLAPFRVGVVKHSAEAELLRRRHPTLVPRPYPDLPTLVAAAFRDEVVVLVADMTATLFQLGRMAGGRRLHPSPMVFPPMELCAAVPKNRPALLAEVEAGFQRIPRLRRRAVVLSWTGVSIGHRIPWQLISVGTLLLILIGGGMAVWIWNDQLRSRIEAATTDLREKQRQLLRSQAELRESQRRYKDLYGQANSDKELYRSLLASSADAILIADQDGRVRYVSPSFTELFGWELDELQDRPVPFSANGDAGDHDRRLRELMEGEGMLRGVDASRTDKHGRSLEVSISASRYTDHTGRFAGTLWMLRDMRETHRLEAELRQSQKMEAIGTLAGGIAHDFNNILSAIIGFADLGRLHVRNPEKMSDYLDRLLAAAHRAKELVRQILTFTRQSERALAPTSLGPLVKETLGLLRASFPATIEIESRMDPGLGPVNADPTQIHQVLMNLCTNARQAMGVRGGGTLTVSLEGIRVGSDGVTGFPDLAPGDYMRLTVADTGPGIPAAIRHRIFDPYFTTKGLGEGTGLGLSVVHGIVNRHGGRVFVESRPGQGTAFHVMFPQMAGEAQAVSRPGPASLASGTERILLVDDEPALATLGRDILGAAGYRVTAVTDSREALERFSARADGFDLVLTDMTMPGMTGTELTRRIRAIRPEIPVFLYTGFTDTITPERAGELGIHAFFIKPVDFAVLAAAIRSVFDGNETQRAETVA